jgi:hypothetical protein
MRGCDVNNGGTRTEEEKRVILILAKGRSDISSSSLGHTYKLYTADFLAQTPWPNVNLHCACIKGSYQSQEIQLLPTQHSSIFNGIHFQWCWS